MSGGLGLLGLGIKREWKLLRGRGNSHLQIIIGR